MSAFKLPPIKKSHILLVLSLLLNILGGTGTIPALPFAEDVAAKPACPPATPASPAAGSAAPAEGTAVH